MIQIVTDSSSYLTEAEALKLGVVMVPLSYAIGRTVYPEAFVDRERRFTHILDSAPTTLHTSQASPSTFLTAFENLKRQGAEILCLTISSRMSGTYGNAVVAARDAGGSGIAVVDSESTAAGLYLLIREARRMIDAGLSLAEVEKRLLALRRRVRLTFSVEDIGPLRRSGRLGGVKLSVSSILNIHPMLSCRDGAIAAAGAARGRRELERQLALQIPADVRDVIVQHYMAEKHLTGLLRLLSEDQKRFALRGIGPVLALHLGKGCMGIAWIDPESTADNRP